MVNGLNPCILHKGLEGVAQAPCDVRIFPCIFRHGGGVRIAHGLLVLSLGADQRRNGNGRVAEQLLSQIVHPMALIRLHQIVHQHRVHQGALHPNAIVQQDLVVVLQVVTNLFNRRIFERATQRIKQGHGLGTVRRKRHKVGRMRLVRKGDADQLRFQRIQ